MTPTISEIEILRREVEALKAAAGHLLDVARQYQPREGWYRDAPLHGQLAALGVHGTGMFEGDGRFHGNDQR